MDGSWNGCSGLCLTVPATLSWTGILRYHIKPAPPTPLSRGGPAGCVPCLSKTGLYWIRGSSTNHDGHLWTGMDMTSLHEFLHGVCSTLYIRTPYWYSYRYHGDHFPIKYTYGNGNTGLPAQRWGVAKKILEKDESTGRIVHPLWAFLGPDTGLPGWNSVCIQIQMHRLDRNRHE